MAGKAKSPGVPPPRKRPGLVYGVVVGMLVWYYVSCVYAVAGKSITFDEPDHLTAGYSFWKYGDFRMQSGGNLPQRWAAIPLLFCNTRFPDRNQDVWRQSIISTVGEQFFYGVGNNADAMLLKGRAMIALFGVALGTLVYFWTRSLLGLGPALVSLGLYAFCPTVLANGPLVTADMCAALFFTASMFCIWRVLHDVNWRTLLVGSLVMGGLFAAKFSAVMLVPMGLLLAAIQLTSRQPTIIAIGGKTWEVHSRQRRLLAHLATIALHAIVVWITIWASYNFRYDMFAPNKLEADQAGNTVVVDTTQIPWDSLLNGSGAIETCIQRMRQAHILPESYLYGFAHMWRAAQRRSAFLNGKYSIYGWPQFFPYCLLVKTPLTLFILLGLAAAAVIRRWLVAGETWQARKGAMLDSLYRSAPLWTLFIVYWAFAITSHLNIGHRHILPTYPPMLIFAGASWLWLQRRTTQASDSRQKDAVGSRAAWRLAVWPATRRWPILASVVLLSVGLFAAESMWSWPNYLAYFNQLVGGPRHAYRHLIDSSLDWGQDLPALKKWLVKEGLNDSQTEKTYLSYFGTGRPTYYGIKATLLPGFFDVTPPQIPVPLEPGTYCISATMAQSLYMDFPGHWNRKYEDAYQKLTNHVRRFYASDPEGRKQLVAQTGPAYWIRLFRLYEQARLARLNSFLRQREPDAEVNYSILIYRLRASDLNLALDGPPIELEEARGAGDQPTG